MVGHPHVSNRMAHRDMDVGGQQDMKYFSTFEKDEDILKAFDDIYLNNNWFDLDCTYSKGVFYKNINQPKIKSDLIPVCDDIILCDSRELKNLGVKVNSIVFDPPFLFRNRKSENNDKISLRFSYFKSYEELIEMYTQSLVSMKEILNKNGYVFFKCQDMTDGKFYCTHHDIIKIATDIGFELRDIGIKTSSKKLQRNANQQNCLAKTHSYWLVLKSKSQKGKS